MQNPFSLTFGKSPLEAVSRPIPTSEIIDNFSSENINQQIFLITGIRGSGKTVLMTEVEKYFRNQKDWIVIELNPELDLLESLLAKLSADSSCAEIIRNARLNLSFWGIGVEIDGVPRITDKETAIIRLMESLKKHGRRILISIDEVTDSEQMRIFSSSFQIFVRQDLPVFLLMTGLFENIEELQNEKNLTFLYRAPKIELKSLNIRAIATKYRSVFNNDEKSALHMAKLTKGYPFAFQVLGYLAWNNEGRYEEVIDEYRQYLEEYVYEKLWTELSPKDRTVLHGIASSGTSQIKDIREALKMDTNSFNPYRKRLVRKGIVSGEERGVLTFTLPYFEDFILSNFEE